MSIPILPLPFDGHNLPVIVPLDVKRVKLPLDLVSVGPEGECGPGGD